MRGRGGENVFMFCYLVELLLDAVEAGFESIAARIDCSIPFREVVDSGTNVDIILRRIRGSTCGRAQKLGIIFFRVGCCRHNKVFSPMVLQIE